MSLYWLHERAIIAIVVTTSASIASSSSTESRADLRLVACLAAVYIIWGSTYLAMRVAVVELPPLLMASMRFASAGVVMLAVALRRGAELPSARDWLRMVPIGVLLFVGGNGFVAIAEQSVSSGGAAVVCATMPLWVAALGWVVEGTKSSAREWLALAVGFAGVVVLMGGPSLAGEPRHVAILCGAPIAWAAGSLLARRTRDIGGEHAALVGPALQMLVGGAALVVVALARGESIPAHASANAWLAVAYLAVFGSLVGFTAYSWLLANARPAVATSYAYVNPVIAVLLGAALYGEELGASTVIANVLVAIAVVTVIRKRSAPGR